MYALILSSLLAQQTYEEAKAQAVAENKRLVVFVGYFGDYPNTWNRAGCVAVTVPSFPGVATAGVVVGVPDGLPGLARCDLPVDATDAQILTVMPPRLLARPAYYPVSFGGCASGRCGR